MPKQISKAVFKAKALELLREVEQTRESLIVTDRGKPVVKVIPMASETSDSLAMLKGSVLNYESPMEPVGEQDWALLPEPSAE